MLWFDASNLPQTMNLKSRDGSLCGTRRSPKSRQRHERLFVAGLNDPLVPLSTLLCFLSIFSMSVMQRSRSENTSLSTDMNVMLHSAENDVAAQFCLAEPDTSISIMSVLSIVVDR